MTKPQGPNNSTPPQWVPALAAALGAVRSQPAAQTVPPRKAAVLVLLTEGPHGIEVLLTERGPGIRYPGEMSLPGGKQDNGDADLIQTALRETCEEVGLDESTVIVLGSLSPFFDPQKTSTVTAVVAWSARPEFPGPVSTEEVAAIYRLPIRDLIAAGSGGQIPGASADAIGKIGTMTADILNAVVALLQDPKVNGT